MPDEILGRDLRLEAGLFGFGLQPSAGDLDTVAGADNLVQALLIRFNTPLGDLASLGHPDYGSRLHELIGRSNDETTRNLVRLFTLETLRQEARVGTVDDLQVSTVAGRPDLVMVAIKLSPIVSQTPVNLVFSVGLEVAA
jgi:phage baseplate assembly protein W